MSDVPETPDGAVEAAAQVAGQAEQDQPSPVMPDGWTGEFDPARAKATIDRLREYEKQVQRLQNDPEAFQEFAQNHGYEFVTDEPEPETPEWDTQDDYEDPNAQRLAQVESRLSEIQQAEEMQQLAAHVAELTQDTGVDLETQKYLFELASQPGYNPDRTKKIVDQHLQAVKAAEEKAVERYLESKRSPSPPPIGSPGQEAPDLRDDRTRREYLGTIINARLQDE